MLLQVLGPCLPCRIGGGNGCEWMSESYGLDWVLVVRREHANAARLSATRTLDMLCTQKFAGNDYLRAAGTT